jgi:hypothetical protein
MNKIFTLQTRFILHELYSFFDNFFFLNSLAKQYTRLQIIIFFLGPWDDKATANAVKLQQLDVLTYLFVNGCPRSPEALITTNPDQ